MIPPNMISDLNKQYKLLLAEYEIITEVAIQGNAIDPSDFDPKKYTKAMEKAQQVLNESAGPKAFATRILGK
jgi:deoxyadenosine/deoxycytidine kinase